MAQHSFKSVMYCDQSRDWSNVSRPLARSFDKLIEFSPVILCESGSDTNEQYSKSNAKRSLNSYYKNDPAKKYLKYAAHYSVIRKITRNGMVSTLKTPEGKYILPNDISGITTDDRGNIVYAANGFARFIARIDLSAGTISSIAGQPYKREWCPVYTPGEGSKAEFVSPETIITNKKGEIIFTDQRLHRVIRVANGNVSTLAGNNVIDPCSQNIAGRAQEGFKDGRALTALFNFPKGIAYDSKGNLFIADMNNHSIRKLSPDGIVTTFAK